MTKIVTGLLMATALVCGAGLEAQAWYNTCGQPVWELRAGPTLFRSGRCTARFAGRGVADYEGAEPFLDRNDQYFNPGWEWGVLVEATLNLDHHQYNARYGWWESNASSEVFRNVDPADGGFLVVQGAAGNWDSIAASQKNTVQWGEVTFGAKTGDHCGAHAYGMGGLIAVDLQSRVNLRAVTPTVTVNDQPVTFDGVVGHGYARNGYTGAGVQVGAFGRSGFLFGLQLWGRVSVHSTIGKSSSAISSFVWEPGQDIAGSDLVLRNDGVLQWVYGATFDLRLVEEFECGCIKGNVQLGWFNLRHTIALSEAPNAGFTDRGDPVGFDQAPNLLRDTAYLTYVIGGPFASIQLTF